MKNYIGFVNDHSGSMSSISRAAMADYNTNITAVKDAATREMLDTVVSVVGVGYPGDYQVTRQVVISNPHVLKPITRWDCNGGTPLYDGIGNMIELFASLPDTNSPEVSFLIMVTTDGEEMHSKKHTAQTLRNLIASCMKSGNWTFVFRVPKDADLKRITDLGIPLDNIQQWETTAAGMAASTQVTTQAMNNYFSLRSSGAKSSNSFFTDASKVNVAALVDISNKVSLYVVPQEDQGIQMRDFILKHRMEYLKGAAFYQLTKTESKVSHTKQILIRERQTGKIYGGHEARTMIGLPTDRNARLHPGDHGNYDIFIQSESINRKLVGGTGVLYWKELGVPFTQAELDIFLPKPVKAVPDPKPVVQLPQVQPTNRPTKSPIPVTPRVTYYVSRGEARLAARMDGKSLKDAGATAPKGQRWYIG